MLRENGYSYSTMRLPKSLSSSTSVMNRKLLSPAAAYAKWASCETTTPKRGTETKRIHDSKPIQKSAAKVKKPKLENLAAPERFEWEDSSPTPSALFLPKSQLWPEEMQKNPRQPEGQVGNEPPLVRAPPPSPRPRQLHFNQKVFSRFFDEAVATSKRRQQQAKA
ncbi:Hypothetical predicted protein [Drosophila guanche]|uniref:Uncharacterized protein n=1 Tax=Drosophila guanche TaxID=7266 RepID=A0A3B0KRX3_DROGU|nr:Hypothetical predicted protein [Drosophila guanche]